MKREFYLLLFLVLFQVSFADPGVGLEVADRHYREAIRLFDQGYFLKSVPVMEQALEIREQILGADHLEVAATLHMVGRLYTLMVYSGKAEAALKRALAIREKHLGSDDPDVGRTIGLLADFYRKTGRMDEAEPLYARSIEILEKAGPDVPDLAEVLRSLSKYYIDKGKYADADSQARRALAIAEKHWGPNHSNVALILIEQATLHSFQKKYVEAEELFKRALSIQEKTIGTEHPDTCGTLNGLALLYDGTARYDEAEALHQKVLSARETRLGPEHPHVAASYNNLGILRYSFGRYSEAVEFMTRAFQIEEKVYGPDHYHVATDMNSLAVVYTAMGRYADAEPLHKRVLESRRKNPAARELGNALNGMAKHYRETGRFSQAEPLYKEAIQVWEEGLGAENPLVATAVGNLGTLYHYSGRLAEAEPLFRKALIISEKALGREHPDVAHRMLTLGNLYRASRRYSEAEPLLLQAEPILEKNFGPENPRLAPLLTSIARLYSATGRTENAKPLLLRSLAIREKTLGTNHPDVGAAWIDLGSVHAQTGEHIDAYRAFSRGIDIQTQVRESVFTLLSERQKLTFAQSQAPGLHQFLSHTARFLSNNSNSVEGTFSSWLLWKGSVQEAQGRYLTALIHSSNEEIRKKWELLQATRRQIARMWLEGPGRMKPELYRSLLMQEEKKRESLEAELSSLSQDYALEKRVGRATPQRIAGHLPLDGVYLDYARIGFGSSIQDQPVRTHYLVFVLTGSPSINVRLFDLGPAEEIDNLIHSYRTEIGFIVEQGRPDRKQTRQMRKYGMELYRKLIQPFAIVLNNKKRILISPDGPLHLIPLEVLISDRGTLMDQFEITYLSSGRDILRWEGGGQGKDAVVIANPDLDLSEEKRPATPAQPGMETSSFRGSVSKQLSNLRFKNLPAGSLEAREVAHFLRGKQIPVQLYTARQALEEVLLSVESPRVLHLATHGYFLEDQRQDDIGQESFLPGIPDADWEDPSLRSGIVLAGANRSLAEGRDEGLVSAMKIEGIQLHGTELVVLSACDTGVGTVRGGEGVFGLKRSFVLAGAQTLILSLWKIPDDTTRLLMNRFYSLWTSGLSKAEAFHKARQEIRRNHENPFYWAAFQLVGNPN